MRISSPVFKEEIKFGIATIVGIFISLATMAEWERRLPFSISNPDIAGNKVTHPGSVLGATSISPLRLRSSV